ncbi:MHYT domain-containing protein [Glycomyces harbinensis]|uniref:MHYT domain-containing protein, NO-binding membrane sensor n=1 Tax=Glycomyces harbinensis TaxID=58114 RepID=A0A1G6W6X3_9ACTN|nr:MHYT domain-containing protein [Glycomyces harbinensis]SDD60957.1 MHYT domain-containing protein, NO-binding membrane sensor [Glycomyces harbinensis]
MIEHFSHGYVTLPVAFLVSMTGSALGLLMARHARRHQEPGRRLLWLSVAAFAIGGTGIWVMHFVAMLGFTVTDAELLYDPGLTALSALIAVAVVACGLFVIGLGRYTLLKLALAGLFTGAGVAAMHYTGMAAVSADVELTHRTGYVIAAVAIAVGAATTALWLSWRLEKTAAIWLAAIVMALAVNLMHYTAMLGVQIGGETVEQPHGAHSMDLIFPMATLTAIVLLVLIFAVVTVPTDEEMQTEARMSTIERELRPGADRSSR